MKGCGEAKWKGQKEEILAGTESPQWVMLREVHALWGVVGWALLACTECWFLFLSAERVVVL